MLDTLTVGTPLILEGVHLHDLTPAEKRNLGRVATLAETPHGLELTRIPRYAGSVNCVGRMIYAPPPFSNRSFLGLVALATGLDDAVDLSLASAKMLDAVPDAPFMPHLAALLVSSAQRLAASHIVQQYQWRQEKLPVVRGRPVWGRAASAVPDGTIVCEFAEKTTDVLINQLVLAGLDGAWRWLADTSEWRRRCRTQRFVWRSLASPHRPTRNDFESCLSQLNRQSLHYRRTLVLAQAVLFGATPDELAPEGGYPLPVFDLAWLFQRLTELMLAELVSQAGVAMAAQRTVPGVLVDALGRKYRGIQPDILIRDGQRTLGVFDAKYKPRYLSGGPHLAQWAKVSHADIYQMYFYAERIRRQEKRSTPLPTFIVAPLVPGSVPPSMQHRTVIWSDDKGPGSAKFRVVGLDIELSVDHLLRAANAQDVAIVAPELQSALVEVKQSDETEREIAEYGFLMASALPVGSVDG